MGSREDGSARQRSQTSGYRHRGGDGSRSTDSGNTSNAQTFADRKVIAVVRKNKTDEIRVAFTTYEGMNLLDVRVFSAFDGGDARPTKKGIAVRIEKLPALIDALQTALNEAERRGLLNSEGAS